MYISVHCRLDGLQIPDQRFLPSVTNTVVITFLLVSGARLDISFPFLSCMSLLWSHLDWISIGQHLAVQEDLNLFVYVVYVMLFFVSYMSF